MMSVADDVHRLRPTVDGFKFCLYTGAVAVRLRKARQVFMEPYLVNTAYHSTIFLESRVSFLSKDTDDRD
jgi:hypothetical protein